jgi:hypothetical protein
MTDAETKHDNSNLTNTTERDTIRARADDQGMSIIRSDTWTLFRSVVLSVGVVKYRSSLIPCHSVQISQISPLIHPLVVESSRSDLKYILQSQGNGAI